MTYHDTAINMIADPDEYTISEIIDLLSLADDVYTNDGEIFINDNEYDALRLLASRIDPSHVYFTGVGSEVRGGKIKLPFEMGSLNRVEIGDIESWISKHNLANENLIVTDKMDGTSAMLVYGEDGKPQIAYSRGNGTEGADITRHIFKIKNTPNQISGSMVIRAEVEMTETSFEFLRDKVKRHSSNEPYKNARNMVGGLMNRKKNPAIVYEHLTVVAYEVVNEPDLSKRLQLEQLEQNGFQVVYWKMMNGKHLTDHLLAEHLNDRKAKLDYAIDGVVIDVNSKEKRNQMDPTRDTLNPEYSIKYKVADEDNLAIATVKGVTWNISKHGFLKPQVNIHPIELVGVTISNATGFNARFIVDNKIGKGAKVKITRSGDVIPFILEVVEPAVTSAFPEEVCEWNETGVDLILTNKDDNDEVVINQLIDFFTKIEVPMLKEGNIRKLFAAGYFAPEHIITSDNLVSVIGENGKKVQEGLKRRLTEIPAYKLLGAFSNERGMGVRKFKKLQKVVGLNAIVNDQVTEADILSVEGFEAKSAAKAKHVLRTFGNFLAEIDGYYSWELEVDTSGGSMEGQKIVFTGFRDADLQQAVEKAGGEMQSGVSGKTTMLVTKNPNSTSGKVQKARDKGVTIVGIDQFRSMV